MWVPDLKVTGAWLDHPHPSSAVVKEGVELYLYFHSGPSWAVLSEFYLYLLPFIILPIQSSHRQSEKWFIKNKLQTSTTKLFLDIFAINSNNIDP